YICYVEGKKGAVEKLFSDIFETKKLKAFCRKVEKKDIDLKTIYQEYLFQCKKQIIFTNT
ncbi:TPA: hypothetical protein ACSK9O_002511, partial [Listeria monocytogenes]